MDKKLIAELDRRLEIRKAQLLGKSKYPITSGHYLRDIYTVLMVLRNDPKARILVKNLPTLEDIKE